ncbi:MAG TPA: ABC transporter substrate-binding protein, partial [Chitinophagaceae bacterium]|nr:ABC transporter substrate-binding protein [Chitinophagaceae bacterium]
KAKDKSGPRIVCVSKQLTELIYAVGGDTALVGVDLSSTYPEAAKKLTTVGYHRALSAEGIISLNPTAVWHDGGIAPEHVITQLQKVGIPLRKFEASTDIPSTKRLIREVAQEFHATGKGDSLCRQIDADMATVDTLAKKYESRPKVIVIQFGRAINQYFIMNKKGVLEKMINWAGGQDGSDTAQKWRTLSPEVLAKLQPDVIFATDYGYDLQGSLEKFKQLPGVALTPAAQHNRIYRVEEHDLIYLGPRTAKNVLLLMHLLHPEATVAATTKH